MDALKPSELASELRRRVKSAKDRLWVASPYIGSWRAVRRILGSNWKDLDAKLLTDKDSGILAKDTLKQFEAQRRVRSLKGLHAKLYIVDDSVLLTSANLTECAFTRRYEAGIFLTGEQAENLVGLYRRLWKRAEEVPVDNIPVSKGPRVDEEPRHGVRLRRLWSLPPEPPPLPPPSPRDKIVEVITRIPVPPGQITLYKALYDSRDGLSKKDLADLIRGGDEKSLTGVIAALSNRVKGTHSLGRLGFKFLIEQDHEDGQIVYRMRPKVRETIEGDQRLDELRKAMKRPVKGIFRHFNRGRGHWLKLP